MRTESKQRCAGEKEDFDFFLLPGPLIYLKRPKGSYPFWITRGSENLRFHVLFGIVHEMSDDCEIVDRRRKNV